jgi:hypothetical protein
LGLILKKQLNNPAELPSSKVPGSIETDGFAIFSRREPVSSSISSMIDEMRRISASDEICALYCKDPDAIRHNKGVGKKRLSKQASTGSFRHLFDRSPQVRITFFVGCCETITAHYEQK